MSAGFAAGMFGAGTFLYISGYLGLANEVTFLFVAAQIVGLAFMSVAPYILNRFGRHRSLACSLAISLSLMTLMLLLPHGHAAVIPLAVLLIPIVCCNAIGDLAPVSMLGDLIDYDTLKTGKKRAATFTSLFVFVSKVNSALGAAVAFGIIGLSGYDAKLGAANGAVAILGLKAAYIVVPCLIYTSAIFFAWTFPIDERRQGIIARRLAQREQRSDAAGRAGPLPPHAQEQVALSAERPIPTTSG
jgi:GPH family glycoside/pentoside/hexuronide:cation symporter